MVKLDGYNDVDNVICKAGLESPVSVAVSVWGSRGWTVTMCGGVSEVCAMLVVAHAAWWEGDKYAGLHQMLGIGDVPTSAVLWLLKASMLFAGLDRV